MQVIIYCVTQEIRFDIRVETAILIATNLTSDATNVITAGLTPVSFCLPLLACWTEAQMEALWRGQVISSTEADLAEQFCVQ